MRTPLELRFWKHVEKTDGCWLWRAAVGRSGYGLTSRDGRQMPAHRAAYELLVGPIPAGLHLDHLCRVRACVNPAHLEPVTCRENLLRGETKAAENAAKTHCPADHPYDDENTVFDARRRIRSCRECGRRRSREWKQRRAQKDAA